MNQLFVNADDFGLHPDINRGILDCVAAGAVRRISISPAGGAVDWPALHDARATGTHLGVHLTLTGEPWVTTRRVIPDWAGLARRMAFGGRRFLGEVEAEIAAQIRLLRDHGVSPEHLDSHQHVHVLPCLWPMCCRLATANGIARLRIPATPTWGLVHGSGAAVVLQLLALQRRRQFHDSLPCLGVARHGTYTMSSLERELALAAGNNIELIVHPGVTTPGTIGRYAAWHYDWSAERELLTSEAFAPMIARHGYRIGP